MKYKLLSFIALFLLMFGCKSLPDNPPIAINKMSKILLDIQIAESYSMGLGDSVKNKYEKNYDSLNSFYISILKHHNISYDDYNDAMKWYKDHPVMMDSLFSAVTKELVTVKTKENIKEPPPPPANPFAGKPKADSLWNAAKKKTVDSAIKAAKTDSLKKIHLKDSLALKNKALLKASVKKADTSHKK